MGSVSNGDDVYLKSNSSSEPGASQLECPEPHAAPADRGKDSGGRPAPVLRLVSGQTQPQKDGGLSETQAALVSRLRRHCVSARQAELLVRQHSAEVIGKALAGVAARRDLINPAGWLVREILDGGYLAPAGVTALETRAAVSQARAAENLAAEAERQRKEEAARPSFDRLAQLPAGEREELLAKARLTVAKFSATAAADDHSLPIRAAMVDLLLARESIVQGSVPHRGGWKELRKTTSVSADALNPT